MIENLHRRSIRDFPPIANLLQPIAGNPILIEEVYNQPFKTGALIDQQGNYALFDILMNKDMFDYIQEHKLYSKAGQQSAENAKLKVDFPAGVNPPKGQIEGGRAGGIIIKVSWKILGSEAEKRRFHTVDAVISMLPEHGSTQRRCVRKTLGLIGFHVMHKTETRLQWIWTSFASPTRCRYWPRVSQRNRRFYAYLTALARRISPFRHGAGVAFEWRRSGSRTGVTMGTVLNEILAYSCMAAFVTGIVVLAAATFIS